MESDIVALHPNLSGAKLKSRQDFLLERVQHEGPVVQLGGGVVGIFDPSLAIVLDNSNTADLLLRAALWDRMWRPDVSSAPWKDVRKVLLEQSSRMSRAERLAALHVEMRGHILAQVNTQIDLGRLAARSAAHPLISMIIGGLGPKTFVRLAAAQDARLERQVQASVKRETTKDRLVYRLLEVRTGRLIARAVRRRKEHGVSEHDDFTGALLGISDRLGMTRVNYLAQTLLIAASTAPAAMAACLLHALTTLPQWRAAIRNELMQLRPGALYEDAVRRKLPVTTAFIKEALRLWSFPLITGRMATRRHDVSGHRIEKGQPYALSSYVMHRCPLRWADPNAFKPERWTVPHAVAERGSYAPFGFGARTCVAAGLGEAQMVLICALFSCEFDIECDGSAESAIEFEGLAFPKNFIGTVRQLVH